jgi:hypothetical protein
VAHSRPVLACVGRFEDRTECSRRSFAFSGRPFHPDVGLSSQCGDVTTGAPSTDHGPLDDLSNQDDRYQEKLNLPLKPKSSLNRPPTAPTKREQQSRQNIRLDII